MSDETTGSDQPTGPDHPAGWLNDPYGRYQQRYWNGSDWTEHVSTGGVQQVDPLGASPVIPVATPPTAFDVPASPPESNTVVAFLDGMGDDARVRPRPSFRSALAGIGGVAIAFGLLAAIFGSDDGDFSRGKGIAVSLVMIVAAYALRLVVKIDEVRAAAVGLLVVAVPVFASAVTVSDGSSGVLTYLLIAVLFILAWALRGFKGRTLLLGLGALALVGMVSTLVDNVRSDSSSDKCGSYLDDGDYDRFYAECENWSGGSDGGSFLPTGLTDNVGSQGVVYLLCAALLLGLTWWLDRRGYHGTATGTVVAGLLSSVVGTVLLANKFGSTTGPLLVLVVGVLVCLVGSHGGRRATTWWGAFIASIGLISSVVVQWEPASPGAVGGALIVSGLLLIGIPLLLEPVRRAIAQANEPKASSGPDQPQPPAAPSMFEPPTI